MTGYAEQHQIERLRLEMAEHIRAGRLVAAAETRARLDAIAPTPKRTTESR